ncbi:MAG: hypothetical protein A3F67_05360 [Verrucomicrobia bacterium RIFCSPHIGHO2_12_FULL_41_10]|nr:MAG: hypothetical protein A3F67_05360 [Verrucomicrobia bacterium RIFCSPHIGHO2_12_FULL_41_10]
MAKAAWKALQGGIEAEVRGEAQLAAEYNEVEVEMERAADIYETAAQAYRAGKSNEGDSWDGAALTTQTSAETKIKAIKTNVKGEVQLAEEYSEVAVEMTRAAGIYEKAAQAYAAGETNEGGSWYYLGLAIQTSAETKIKAIKANVKGEVQLAEKYSEVAVEMTRAIGIYKKAMQAYVEAKANEKAQLAAEYSGVVDEMTHVADIYEKAAQAYRAGKSNEGDSWYNLGFAIKKGAETTIKAIEAAANGNAQLAAEYNAATVEIARAVNIYEKAAQAYAAGKTNEGDSWNDAGLAIQASEGMTIKASEAKANGKGQLAAEYSVVAAEMARAVNIYEKAAQAHATGKTNEGDSWDGAGCAVKTSAEMKIKAIELEVDWEDQPYGATAIDIARAVDIYEKAAQAYAAGKTNEGDNWYNEGIAIQRRVETKIKAIEAKANGEAQLAAEYNAAVVEMARAVNIYEKAAQAYAAGTTNEGDSWNNEGLAIQTSAETKIKAIEAKANGEAQLAAEYSEAVVEMARVVDIYEQAIQAYTAGKSNEGNSWNNAGLAIQTSAETTLKAIEAKTNGKCKRAAKYSAAAAEMTREADTYEEAAKAYTAGKSNEGDSWNNAGIAIHKAIEAKANGKARLAAKYNAAAVEMTRAADIYKKAAKAYTAGKADEGDSWNNAGLAIQNSEYYCYATNALDNINEALGNIDKARKLNENNAERLKYAASILEKYRFSVEFDAEASEEEIKGNKEVTRLKKVNWITKHAAEAVADLVAVAKEAAEHLEKVIRISKPIENEADSDESGSISSCDEDSSSSSSDESGSISSSEI